MKHFPLHIAGAVLALFLAAGCGGKPGKITPRENPYVAAYTGGAVSVHAVVKVRLAQPCDSTAVPGKLFRLSPSVAGDTYWEDSRTLVFRPRAPLKKGTDYTVRFDVAKLYPEAVGDDRSFAFSFATFKPAFSYNIGGLKLYGDDQPGRYFLYGTVHPSDITDSATVKKLLQATADGRTLDISWQHHDTWHAFSVENLQAGDRPYPVLLAWNGRPMDYDFARTDTVEVPRKGAFEVLNVTANTADHSIECTFSAPVDADQSLAASVQVGDFERLRFAVSSNRLTVYLPRMPDAGSVRLTLRQGLKSKDGLTLAEDYSHIVLFEQLKPAVRRVGKGVIMPNSNGLTVPFQAVSLHTVEVQVQRIYEDNVLQFLQSNDLDGDDELYRVANPIAGKTIRLDDNKSLNLHRWNTFSVDLSTLITPEPGAIYRVDITFNKSGILYACDGDNSGNDPSNGLVSAASSDEDEYDEYDYGDRWENRDNPCHSAYYDTYFARSRFVSQNVLASDIGLVAKRGSEGGYLVFATSLVTAQPMSGVKVTLYDYAQQPIGTAHTDGNGVAQVQVEGTRTPFVLVAQQGSQKSYLRLSEGLSLSLSSFDVAGARVEKGLKGLLYGERGVWRPGDTLFLTFVLEDRTRRLPANHPVVFELYNVHHQLVSRQVRTEGTQGFYTFACTTSPDAPSGSWQASVKVGGVTFSRSLRVATVKPNRLKIDTRLTHDPVYSGQSIGGTLKAAWLHGAKADGNKADITVQLQSVRPVFKGFEDYRFDDITHSFTFYPREEDKSTGTLNSNGEMDFHIPITFGHQTAPGKLQAAVAVRVFEEGGEFSTDHFAVDVFPYKSYVGLKPPQGTGYYHRLESGREQRFEVVALDDAGKPLERTLDVEIFRNEWDWWWFSSDNALANYASRLYENKVHSTTVRTDAAGRGAFTYQLDYPDWGLLLVKVTDPVSGHSTVQKVYIDWYAYGRGTGDEDNTGAFSISVSTDKPGYAIGEKAVVTIPSMAGAKAIVTVENGSRVLSSQRVDCRGSETTVTIPTTADMAPNAYVFVTILQPHAQTANDLPIRLYGVAPLPVEDPATRLSPVVTLPDVIRPEEAFTVKVKETNGKDMSYTLAIVDEGLLDLTRYKTPDLWAHFFQREALGVRTWDLYNFVLGAYGGKIEQLFAIGGDGAAEELSNAGSERANRFRPVVKFAGPFTVQGGRTKEHTFTLSNYVGSVRVMVVAGNGTAYGTAEKTVPVRNPLMVQATLPRVLGPGDEVTLPAAVFAMEKQVKQVKVTLQTGGLLEPLDGTSRTLHFAAPGDDWAKFNLRVKNELGVARVKVIATSGNERAEHTIEIDVRASNPPTVVTAEKVIPANASAELLLQPPGMDGTNSVSLEVSSIPPLNLGQRLQYLLQYPHGCLEQTTSCAFPQLYLPDVVAMTTREKERMTANVQAALRRLPHFAKSDGSFSYWPGGGYSCEWTNSYAGHFMIEAEQKGYQLPGGLKERWIAAQQRAARDWSLAVASDGRYAYRQDDLIQAYRLYVLALAKKQELGAMNRLKERTGLSVPATWMLAGAYALAGQPEAANRMIAGIPTTAAAYTGFTGTYGSPDRDHAIILDVLSLLGQKENAFLMARRTSEALNTGRWMSTQTTAFCLMGISKYALHETGSLHFAHHTGGKTENVTTDKMVWNAELGTPDTPVTVKVDNKNNHPLFARLTAKGTPAGGNEQPAEHDLKMTVRYVRANGEWLDVSRLSQGTDFAAEVTITNPGLRGSYSNLALTQIFPAGWEIIDDRLHDATAAGSGANAVTYRDIRDDRVYAYFDLPPHRSITVKVKLRAAYVGKYYLPAVSCEAMYDAGIYAVTAGQKVAVN